MTWSEHDGDLWEVDSNAIVITTNGVVNSTGQAVMGRGCAKEAVDAYPKLAYRLGKRITKFGNIPFVFLPNDHGAYYKPIITLPVKHNWQGLASKFLIWDSLKRLVSICESLGLVTVSMPRPGCGSGGLSWDSIQPRLSGYLHDSVTEFVVCHKEGL